MAARRCSLCALDYPMETAYQHCLRCGEDTDRVANLNPMTKGDLDELKREVAAVKQRVAGTNEQWLITYNDRQGQNANGEYRSEQFFATAYDVDECHRQMHLCRRVYDLTHDQVRAIVATGRPPKDGGPVAVVAT